MGFNSGFKGLTRNTVLSIRTLHKCLTSAFSLSPDIQLLSTGTAVTKQQKSPSSAPTGPTV